MLGYSTVMVLSVLWMAPDGQQTAQPPSMFQGEVVSVDGDSLVVRAGNRSEKRFLTTPETLITIDGKAAKLSELKRGDSVSIALDGAGKVVAITCMRSP